MRQGLSVIDARGAREVREPCCSAAGGSALRTSMLGPPVSSSMLSRAEMKRGPVGCVYKQTL